MLQLRYIYLYSNSLSGTLPASWSALSQVPVCPPETFSSVCHLGHAVQCRISAQSKLQLVICFNDLRDLDLPCIRASVQRV